ncbi:cadherin-like beta sandwich domain-containing protein [Paenibacillus oenotherae]|uniref:Cadherin-like beta sandwich domain-containing protein n=1 Tax=Paenibacillus oenotherae TaxID=1435645 RepID=A0ABS7D4F7_9BACL|nr:cadherin-like beta sandwich domain-containing protein [Paenibacillus oenotherae]MBW7474827.1 cadherin-like beta sandwich domain-containing protein [Paenibacillus oenotherae]
MEFNFRRRTALLVVCILVFGLLSGLMPYGSERAYAGTGGEIYTVAGGEYGDSGDGGAAVDAELSGASAVAVDGSGNLYIADTGNNKIRKVLTNGSIITVAGSGGYDYSGDGDLATSAQLRSPSGVAVDVEGNLYIADKYNNRIRKVDTSGIISTIAGTGGNDYSGDGGLAVAAQLSSPGGVAVDSEGNLYIADTSNHRIRKVDADGIITTVAGSDDSGFSGDGGSAITARLYYPDAVAADSHGNLYIADTYNNRIRKVDTSGIMSTVAGSSGVDGYSGDGGPAVSAQLNEPEGVTVDGSGNLYIADTDNNRIRKVNPNGNITTLVGTGAANYSGDGGPGMLAEIDSPSGLVVDSSGNLYIADKYNYAIRKQLPYIPSSDASLSNITLSSGTLSPVFASGTTDYTASVVNGVSSIRVTPTTADSFMTVKVNGESVASGAQSGDINLDVGDNTITLAVLAEDGVTTKTYTITIERLRSSNANLSQLSLSSGTLSPAFASNTTSYSVDASQSAITVTPTMADPLANVKVNGTAVTNGAASHPIPLNVGSSEITIVVTAQDETTTKTYTINVTRTISANADLSGLTLSNGTLSPSFGSGITSYTASVGNAVSGIAVTPTVADGSAEVTVNGVPTASGAASAALPLNVGSNTIEVQVTAEDGTLKTYTVTVTRAASSNADLSDLTLSSGTLIPSFIPDTFKTSVDYQVSSVTVTPMVSDTDHATVTVSLYSSSGSLVSGPNIVTSGTASPSLPLGVGNNTITIVVTAEDGTTRTYTVAVTRGASSNADLSNLTLSSGTLVPAFAGTYTANVGHRVSSVTVTTALSDAASASVTASVYDGSGTRVSGPHALTSGAASPSLPLNVGNNEISILVKAQDGSTRMYTVMVTRAASSSADLSGLTLSGGTLSPAFEPDTTSYTASVGNSANSVTVTMGMSDAGRAATTASVYNGAGTPINGPFVMSSGTAAFSLPLNVGDNEISILVRTEDGTAKTYTVTVTRAASSNVNLSGLTLSNGTLSPSFGSGTTSYTANVGNSVSGITVTPAVADGNAAVTVNGVPVTSGAASASQPLNVGNNAVSILVTAQDGSSRTYKVVISREAPVSAPPYTGGGGSAPVVNEPVTGKPVIDLNGRELDPSGIDTGKPFVTLEAEAVPTDGVVVVGIPAAILTDFAVRNADFYVVIKTPYGSYQVPANLALLIPELPELLAKNKLQAGDISFRITLADKSGDKNVQAGIANALPNGQVLGPIVDFRIDIVHTKTGLAIGTADKFEKPLTRWIPLPNNTAGLPKLWGAFRYHEATKKLEFVPAKMLKQDGVSYAAIRSYTNSVYIAAANAVSFADVERHWSESTVELAAAKRLVEGTGGGQFDPDRVITRAEFTAMLVRTLTRGSATYGSGFYNDVAPDAWYFEAVSAAKELGLLRFASGSSFKPDQPLTREEMASILAAAIVIHEEPIIEEYASLDGYKDIESVNASYLEDVRLMVKLQIMTGIDEDAFSPQGATTRAQAAVVLIRTLRQLDMID